MSATKKRSYRLAGLPKYRLLLRYLQSILLVLLASAISIPVHFVIEPVNLVMLYLAAVMIAAVFLGRGPAMLASLLSVLMFNFSLVEPRLSFTVADTQYFLTFFGLLTVGLVISNSTARLREQLEVVRQREAHTAALNSLSQDLTGALNLDDMLNSVVWHVSHTINCPVIILLPEGNRLTIAAASEKLDLDEVEFSAADWAYQRQTPAGYAGQEQSPARLHYLPLKTSYGTVGVLGIKPNQAEQRLISNSHQRLLQGFANLAALAIERVHLAEQASQALVLKNTERLQAALLHSISHELRTPLVSITGALSTLAEVKLTGELDAQEQSARQELIDTAYGEAQRLNLLVSNLLDMSRLEAGAFHLSLEPCDMQDLIGIALSRFAERKSNHQVNTVISEGLPLLSLDAALMVQVLFNLLENAAKYSPEASSIDVHCSRKEQEILLVVSDRGIGIPVDELERVFDKFYRSSRSQRIAGLGLGLSISKGIVEVHGGRIWAENRPGGGITINVALPVQPVSNREEG